MDKFVNSSKASRDSLKAVEITYPKDYDVTDDYILSNNRISNVAAIAECLVVFIGLVVYWTLEDTGFFALFIGMVSSLVLSIVSLCYAVEPRIRVTDTTIEYLTHKIQEVNLEDIDLNNMKIIEIHSYSDYWNKPVEKDGFWWYDKFTTVGKHVKYYLFTLALAGKGFPRYRIVLKFKENKRRPLVLSLCWLDDTDIQLLSQTIQNNGKMVSLT